MRAVVWKVVFGLMALPLILFPATLTNSASVMLMPSVASLQALGHEKKIRHVIRRTCENCFFFGGFCSGSGLRPLRSRRFWTAWIFRRWCWTGRESRSAWA